MTGEEYEEYQQIQFHNERKVDATINRIMERLERINVKLDMLATPKAVVPRVYK